MLLFCPSKDQDVVQVDHHDAFCYEVPEDVVHHSLEGGWTVSHAKEHYQGFEQASIGPEGCLGRFGRLNSSGTQVLFQERVQLLLFHQRQGVDLR